MKEFDELVNIISKLREECPWDKEQTHESLSKHLIEEAYELLDSLAKLNDKDESFKNLEIELGDLLLQILLHSKIASENGYFSIVNVVDSLNKKLVKRHPHVFGDIKLDTPKEVEKQWERIKQEDQHSIFDDIDNNLPAITTAFKAQRKAEEKYLRKSENRYRSIIIAASRGKKLSNLTKDKPKCMLDIRGKPLLRRLVSTMNKNGINDVSVVRGYKKEKIKFPSLEYFDNDKFESTGEASSLS